MFSARMRAKREGEARIPAPVSENEIYPKN